jgi:predicted PurR-regulated permease PerM
VCLLQTLLGNNNKNNECNMRDLKSELADVAKHNMVVLQNMPQHHELVKANKVLLLVVCSLMLVIFLLGFLILPDNEMLENYKASQQISPVVYTMNNPALTDEINLLKGQFVGLVSGSIESKLRTLEASIQMGQINTSLGTIQDLKNDIKVLQSYSMVPIKKTVKSSVSDRVLKEVSQLKSLIYLTLTSCGLIIAAIGGIWIKHNYRLVYEGKRAALGKRDSW